MSLAQPRLIATDLDGTIVPFDASISSRTVNAIVGALEKGAIVYFVTGRPPRWLGDITDAFGPLGVPITICGNGALVFDVTNNCTLFENFLQPEVALEVVKRLRAHIVDAAFACEFGDEFRREVNYHARWDLNMDPDGVEAIEKVIDRPCIKLLARCTSGSLSSDAMLEIAMAEIADLVEVTHSNPEDSLLEISALGVNKGSTLARMAASHGLNAADCIAFGDQPNDVSMLNWAGRSWAMGSAHRDAKLAANFIAADCNDDGVAAVLEELFDLDRRDD
ncbi:MAG TPA: HAD family hydrolase [Candidatus Nanopelagicaceae bacterium]|nr:HAD family hydrolase [Candidatus Nanopelagicaceae bacterium]